MAKFSPVRRACRICKLDLSVAQKERSARDPLFCLALLPFLTETCPIHRAAEEEASWVRVLPFCPFLFISSALPLFGKDWPSLAWGTVQIEPSCHHRSVCQSGRPGPGQPKAKSTWDRDPVPRNDSCSGAAPGVCPWDWQLRMVTHFLAAPRLEQPCHRALWAIQRGHAVQTVLWKVTPRGYHREWSHVGQGVRWVELSATHTHHNQNVSSFFCFTYLTSNTSLKKKKSVAPKIFFRNHSRVERELRRESEGCGLKIQLCYPLLVLIKCLCCTHLTP